MLRDCLGSLAPTLDNSKAIVVDDGSEPPLASHPALKEFCSDARFVFLRHEVNRGPGAARDTGIGWARSHGAPLVILLDADCLVEADFVRAHLELNRRHPEAVCCGGSICGRGRGVWAFLDDAMSWFTSMREAPAGPVSPPYHIPTTNMSLKLAAFTQDELFDHRLRTGEDVAFIQEIRRRGQQIFFSPQPAIIHRDRESLRSFLLHQYRWGLHTYVVRRGLTRMDLGSRMMFAAAFIAGSPLYVLLATWLNLRPLLRRRWLYVALAPVLALMYAIKCVAVLDGTLHPHKALFDDASARDSKSI